MKKNIPSPYSLALAWKDFFAPWNFLQVIGGGEKERGKNTFTKMWYIQTDNR